ERTTIQQRCQQLGVTDRVHLLGNRADTPRLLSAMDVFTLCSLNEASPVSILEALACETVVVSTDVGSIGETVIAGQTGVLVASEDVEGFSQAISELLDNAEARESMGRCGRRLVMETGSLNSM